MTDNDRAVIWILFALTNVNIIVLAVWVIYTLGRTHSSETETARKEEE